MLHWPKVRITSRFRDDVPQIYLGHDLDLVGSRDVYNFWRVESYRRRNHPRQILSRLVKGLDGYGSPKSGVSDLLTLNVALTTVLRTHVLHCDHVHWTWNCCRAWLIGRSSSQYRKRQFHGMSLMSYTIENIQRRSFYTYVHANLNGMSRILVLFFCCHRLWAVQSFVLLCIVLCCVIVVNTACSLDKKHQHHAGFIHRHITVCAVGRWTVSIGNSIFQSLPAP